MQCIEAREGQTRNKREKKKRERDRLEGPSFLRETRDFDNTKNEEASPVVTVLQDPGYLINRLISFNKRF